MNECPEDSQIEFNDPLENGLRILARIIARDIAAKRSLVKQANQSQVGKNDGNL